MEEAYKGWRYVNTLLDYMFDEAKKRRENHVVAPRYIFRGVTQRFFTSSKSIQEYLKKNPGEIVSLIRCKANHFKYNLTEKDIEELGATAWVKAQRNYYRKVYGEFKKELSVWQNDSQLSPKDTLHSIVSHPNYQYIIPQYIRSGAAVRLFKQQNRTQNDYISYIRNLIAETKSRFPLDYSTYSDLEILADIQHKGGASCLVDFSTNFLVSLWFATQDYATSIEEMGYLYCYDVNTDAIEEDSLTILNKNKERNTIEELILETSKSTKFNGKESYKFWLWKPSNINSRISRQDSIFVFGIEKFLIKEHPVIVIPIPFEWKKSIQYVLKEYFGLYGETIFGDTSGLSTINSKTKPLKTQTQYFEESYLYQNIIEDNRFKGFELFQKGTSALLKAQYDVALDFFCSFEGTNYAYIQKLNNAVHYTERNYNVLMILVELFYSKGMSLRHSGRISEATTHYKKALNLNLNILHDRILDFSTYNSDEICSVPKGAISVRYATNKLFKILEDYIVLLYDSNHLFDAYMTLVNVLETLRESQTELPANMELLIRTACNEIKVLSELMKNPRFREIDLIDTTDISTNKSNAFCKVLNIYFKQICSILHNKIDAISIEESEELSILNNSIRRAIESQEIIDSQGYKQQNSVFTAWNLCDIKSVTCKNLKGKPQIRKAIMYLTSLVEDCQKQIEGRKRQEIY